MPASPLTVEGLPVEVDPIDVPCDASESESSPEDVYDVIISTHQLRLRTVRMTCSLGRI